MRKVRVKPSWWTEERICKKTSQTIHLVLDKVIANSYSYVVESTLLTQLQKYRRIVVVGTTGSGKTTLTKALAVKLNLPIIELDQFRHGPNWTSTPDEEFRSLVVSAINCDEWIVDGNYGIARDLIWNKAEAIIWLNYSFTRIFWQLLKRTIRRSLTKEVLWNGNTENWRRSFLSSDSILLWALKSHPEKKKKYPILFDKPKYSHIKIIEVRDPHEVKDILLI